MDNSTQTHVVGELHEDMEKTGFFSVKKRPQKTAVMMIA
jgi:hypothetical protein